jgi:hypothetical protein
MQQVVDYKHYRITCYGELRDCSNFAVVCEEEDDDGIWCEGNPNSEDYTFSSWEEVVKVLTLEFDNIVEITAV